MPKLPLPPRRAQNSSAFSSADARTTVRSAVTTSIDTTVVAGPAVAAREVAEAAADGEAGDRRSPTRSPARPPGRAAASRGRRRRACSRPARGRAAGGVDPHAAQQRQVDHQPAVAHRQAGDVVAAAAHGVDDAGARARSCTARTTSAVPVQRAISAGPAVDHRVPDLARLVVGRVVRREQRAAERGLEGLQRRVGYFDDCAIELREAKGHGLLRQIACPGA